MSSSDTARHGFAGNGTHRELAGDWPGGGGGAADVVERLIAIERRLMRLEEYVGLAPSPALPAESIEPTPPIAPLAFPPPLAASPITACPPPLPQSPPLGLEVPAEPLAPSPEPQTSSQAQEGATAILEFLPDAQSDAPTTDQPEHAAPTWAPPMTPLLYEARPEPEAPSPAQSALEQVIGLKLAGWVGAIVLVIGAGLGIKFLYDIKFFSGVSPVVWLTLLWMAGFALIAAGEWVYRRINRVSATGLFGAGVATLFLVSYAGHGYYGLYQQGTAFALMALSALVGAGVAMRAKLVSIAVLSLLGGFLAPLVLEGDSTLIVPFLSYLLALQAVALVLAWWGGTAHWWTLRTLSLVGTAAWVGMMIDPSRPWGPTTFFVLLYAAMYQLELILSARRVRVKASAQARAGVTFSIIVTALLTAALLVIFRDAAPAVRGIWVVSLSAATVAMAMALATVRQAEDVRLRALAYGYRVQAAVLLLVAVPVAFSGAAMSVGWAGVALALAAAGARLDDRPARVTAVIAWALAVINVIGWRHGHQHVSEATATWLTILGQPLVAWAIVAWGLSLVGQAMAWLFGTRATAAAEPSREQHDAPAMSAFATALFAFVTVLALPPLTATGVLLAAAWAMVALDVPLRRLALLPQAWGLLLLAALKWAVVDTILARLSSDWSPATYRPLLNPQLLLGVALAGSMLAIYRLRRGAIRAAMDRLGALDAKPAVVILAAATILVTLGLSAEVDRVVAQLGTTVWPRMQVLHLGWTMLWTASAVIFLLLNVTLDPSARSRRDWRRGAWALAGLLAIKFIVVDTLFWWWSGDALATVRPLVNLQTIAALAVTGGLVLVHRILGPAGDRDGAGESDREELSGLKVGLAALAVILWAGTLEIDRLVASGAFPGLAVWPRWQLRQFAWTAWWTIGVTSFLAIVHFRDATAIRRVPMLRTLASVPVLLAVKYLLLDTLFYRLFRGPAPAAVVANLQTLCGALVFASLVLVRHLIDDSGARDAALRKIARAAGAAAVIMLLWLGTLEIDRAFLRSPTVMAAFADPRRAAQVAMSIFWSLFAIGCVVAGFAFRVSGLRYFGLALFALTLLKVGVIDLQNAETGYRILSFMGLGALLLVTSVVYGKLSPKLLGQEARGAKPQA